RGRAARPSGTTGDNSKAAARLKQAAARESPPTILHFALSSRANGQVVPVPASLGLASGLLTRAWGCTIGLTTEGEENGPIAELGCVADRRAGDRRLFVAVEFPGPR